MRTCQYLIIIFLAILPVIHACDKKEEEEELIEGDDSDPIEKANPEESFAVIDAEDLLGSWQSECQESMGSYGLAVYAFDEGGVEIYSRGGYSGEDCAGAYTYSLTLGATYELGTEPLEEIDQSATLDITIGAVFMHYTQAATINQLNADETCGYSDWTANVDKNITGCAELLGGLFNVGDVLYEIVKLEDDQIFLGLQTDELDGNSADTRPVEFDPDRGFSPQ